MTDDTAALQGCLDKHAEVFLPKGLFRISKTLSMRPGGAIVGLSQTHSVIAPASGGFGAVEWCLGTGGPNLAVGGAL